MDDATDLDRVGLAELLASLSLGIDLGFGQPMEHVVRQCAIALRTGEHFGLDDEQRSVVYYTALLTNVGCHTDAHEQAKWFGDDITLKGDKYEHGLHGMRSAFAGIRRLGSGQPALQRFRIGLNFALSGHRELEGMIASHAALARSLAREVGLPVAVQDAVAAAYEQWDGKGWPGSRKGDAIPIAARVSQLAEFIEVAHRSGGTEAAVALAEQLAGSQFDPNVAACFVAAAGDILAGLDATSAWDQVIAAEPGLSRPLSGTELDEALVAIADFVDLKSPYTLGHARGVAQIVEDAGTQLGLEPEPARTLRRAGLAQGLGRLGISNAIWDKPGPLGAGEWERVRLQPYLTERILQQSSMLAPIGALAGQLRERVDGSGYPHGLTGSALSLPARVLAAADVYQSMIEPRPYRAARQSDDAAAELRSEARAGRLDGDATEAVLGMTVHPGGPAPFDVLADDVVALIAALGLEQPCVAGFSEGGATATLVALRAPGAIRALVNHSGFDYYESAEATAQGVRVFFGGSPDATEADSDAADQAFSAIPPMAATFATMKADYDAAQGDGYWRTYLGQFFDRSVTPIGATFEDFGRLSMPTLILTGDRDMFCSVEAACEAYHALPNGELCVVPNTGHDVTPAVIDATIDFFARQTAGA